MNQTEHHEHRHDGAEDRQPGNDRAEPQGRQSAPRGLPTRPPVRSVAVWGPIAAVTFLAFLVTIGVWRRIHERSQEKAFTKQATQVEVNVVNAQRDRKPKELILPGTFQAFQETTIYPRSNGYVKSWKVDIGDDVAQGQLLAEIETPELDQQGWLKTAK
jgi:multidrug efflux pump subunit AcrA (membrane-fusion protein)